MASTMRRSNRIQRSFVGGRGGGARAGTAGAAARPQSPLQPKTWSGCDRLIPRTDGSVATDALTRSLHVRIGRRFIDVINPLRATRHNSRVNARGLLGRIDSSFLSPKWGRASPECYRRLRRSIGSRILEIDARSEQDRRRRRRSSSLEDRGSPEVASHQCSPPGKTLR
jgi:hypothetical protein